MRRGHRNEYEITPAGTREAAKLADEAATLLVEMADDFSRAEIG